jgi:hypothetical protein
MTVLDNRRSVASGTWNQPEPPPELPNVDDAQQFYLFGAEAYTAWSKQHIVPVWVSIASSRQVKIGRLLPEAMEELLRLRQLGPRWNGRKAPPITDKALYSAAGIVLPLMLREQAELPQFFPLPDGGIQIEWYAEDQVEIEVDASGEVYAVATASDGETIADGILDPLVPSDLSAIITGAVVKVSEQIAAGRRQG